MTPAQLTILSNVSLPGQGLPVPLTDREILDMVIENQTLRTQNRELVEALNMVWVATKACWPPVLSTEESIILHAALARATTTKDQSQ